MQSLAQKNNYDYQKIDNLVTQKLKDAEPAKKYIDDEVKKIVSTVPNTAGAYAPIKSWERTMEKTIKEESGNPDNIKDIARNTIVPKTTEAKDAVIKLMDARKDIARKKIQSPAEFMGYEGIIYNIKTDKGFISETQVVSPKMTFGKNLPKDSIAILGEDVFNQIKKETGLEPGYGHKLYEDFRSLSREDRPGAKGASIIKESLDYYSKLR